MSFDFRITLPQVFMNLWIDAWLSFWDWLGRAVLETCEMTRLMAREFAAAEHVAREDDERMARAARGEPFWRQGPPAGEVVGLEGFIPRKETS